MPTKIQRNLPSPKTCASGAYTSVNNSPRCLTKEQVKGWSPADIAYNNAEIGKHFARIDAMAGRSTAERLAGSAQGMIRESNRRGDWLGPVSEGLRGLGWF